MARIIKAAKGDVEPSRAQVSRRVEEAEHRAEGIVLRAGDEGYDQGLADAHDLVRRVEEVEQQPPLGVARHGETEECGDRRSRRQHLWLLW